MARWTRIAIAHFADLVTAQHIRAAILSLGVEADRLSIDSEPPDATTPPLASRLTVKLLGQERAVLQRLLESDALRVDIHDEADVSDHQNRERH